MDITRIHTKADYDCQNILSTFPGSDIFNYR